MKKTYFYAAAFMSAAALVAPAPADASFKDVKMDTEQGEAIQSLVDRKIISGYADGTFKPGNPVTRAQIAKILVGALDLNTTNVKNPNFSDVPTTDPNYKYIAALQNAGILNGSNGKYNPNAPVTRGQVAKILVNAYKLVGSMDISFTDVKGTGYEEYVSRLYGEGITTGISETLYGINNPVKRGQLAVFIQRLEELYPVGSATLLLEELGFKVAIYPVIFSTNDEEIAELHSYGSSSITVKPLKTGTAYLTAFDMGEYGPTSGDDIVSGVTYQIDVTNGTYGLKTTLTRLDEVIDPPYSVSTQ